ncbi:MAG TPA: VCBS repeat-containing protein, partial [Chthoniobacteraceae bacterium]|nr:VCBS repeat-containing protein [Chthoniobacteraceae bacterium]
LPAPTLQFTNFASLQQSFGRAEIADLDSDGLLDVVSENGVRFYRNTGTNFAPSGSVTNYNELQDYPLPLLLADFDNDSDVDLFLARRARYYSGSSFPMQFYSSILWNTGAMGFTHATTLPFTPVVRAASAAGDFDNDGDLDLVVSGSTNLSASFTRGKSLTVIYENLGNGEFATHAQTFPGLEEGFLAWADYDSDGDLDLLASGYTNNSRGITVLYRNDDGHFTDSGAPLPVLVSQSYLPIAATFGDFDNDSDLDFLLGGVRVPGLTSVTDVYRNDQSVFTRIPVGATNFSETRVIATWGDLNCDGYLDVVRARSYTVNSDVFLNDRSGGFLPTNRLSFKAERALLVDVDNDSRLDFVSQLGDLPITIYRNITEATNTPPVAPANLSETQTNGSVTFSWDAALDLQQTNGLTYNLRIGTTPGGSEVMSAMANPTNGQRLIAAIGNTGLRTNWTIHKFRPGTYYWSVQAIDHSYAGSPFAPELSFTVSNTLPVVELHSLTNVTANSVTANLLLDTVGELTTYYLEFTSADHSGTSALRIAQPSAQTLQRSLFFAGLNSSNRYEIRLVASNQFGVAYSSPRAITTVPATPLTELTLPFAVLLNNPRFLAADLEGDGDLDIIQSGTRSSRRVHLTYLNDSAVFVSGPEIVLTNFTSSTGVGIDGAADLLNDGILDLLFNGNSRPFPFYRSETNHHLGRNFPFSLPYQSFFADSDNDGDIDLLTFNGPLAAMLYRNDNFESWHGVRVSWISGQMADWGDYDNDGDLDILAWGLTNEFQINPTTATTRILRNDGNNLFTDIQAGLPGVWQGANWIDCDNDADLDVLLAYSTNAFGTNEIRLIRNDGTNGFAAPVTVVSGNELTILATIDFDRDGRPDFFTHQDLPSADKLRLFLNSGDGHFSEFNLALPPLTNLQARFADFDGDAMPDILIQAAVTNISQARLHLFHNNLLSTNPLPPIPVNLASTVSQTTATLTWELPVETDSTNLTAYAFNLRVGTTPRGSELMSAMSHPVTGARHLSQRGNAGQGRSWTIRDLPPGTYYWSVQSMDHAYNGSPFPPGETFVIEPYERPPQFLGAIRESTSVDLLTIDAPIRSRVYIEKSLTLTNDWTLSSGYHYIGAEPVTVRLNSFENTYYRFRLLDDDTPGSPP